MSQRNNRLLNISQKDFLSHIRDDSIIQSDTSQNEIGGSTQVSRKQFQHKDIDKMVKKGQVIIAKMTKSMRDPLNNETDIDSQHDQHITAQEIDELNKLQQEQILEMRSTIQNARFQGQFDQMKYDMDADNTV